MGTYDCSLQAVHDGAAHSKLKEIVTPYHNRFARSLTIMMNKVLPYTTPYAVQRPSRTMCTAAALQLRPVLLHALTRPSGRRCARPAQGTTRTAVPVRVHCAVLRPVQVYSEISDEKKHAERVMREIGRDVGREVRPQDTAAGRRSAVRSDGPALEGRCLLRGCTLCAVWCVLRGASCIVPSCTRQASLKTRTGALSCRGRPSP